MKCEGFRKEKENWEESLPHPEFRKKFFKQVSSFVRVFNLAFYCLRSSYNPGKLHMMFTPKPAKSLYSFERGFFAPLLQHFGEVYISRLFPYFARLLGEDSKRPDSRESQDRALDGPVLHQGPLRWHVEGPE